MAKSASRLQVVISIRSASPVGKIKHFLLINSFGQLDFYSDINYTGGKKYITISNLNRIYKTK